MTTRRVVRHIQGFLVWNLIYKLNDFNGHFRNKDNNNVRWAGLVSLARKREKGTTIQLDYRKWGTHARVFSQHYRRDQQEINIIFYYFTRYGKSTMKLS